MDKQQAEQLKEQFLAELEKIAAETLGFEFNVDVFDGHGEYTQISVKRVEDFRGDQTKGEVVQFASRIGQNMFAFQVETPEAAAAIIGELQPLAAKAGK